MKEILTFCQSGLNQHSALNTIRGQISALAVRKTTSHSLVKVIVQGFAHIVSPVHSPIIPWDLNLAPLAFLEETLLNPLGIPVAALNLKVACLVSFTSLSRVSEPYSLMSYKVVLRPKASFLPKVVSFFRLNQCIVLPSFLLQNIPGSFFIHCLYEGFHRELSGKL